MSHVDGPGYGLWPLVVLNSLLFIVFAASFAPPKSSRDWRALGTFAAFVVALFTEMYGFPLTIYLVSGWLGSRYPALAPFTHDNGHLWHTLLRLKGDPHWDVLHLASNVLIFGGFWMLSVAWKVLYQAQRRHELATSGLYARMRHPQYAAFVVIMLGFLLQWPTLPTLVMFPVLVYVYARLARHEEQEVRREFGELYERYASQTPAFLPRLRTENAVPKET